MSKPRKKGGTTKAAASDDKPRIVIGPSVREPSARERKTQEVTDPNKGGQKASDNVAKDAGGAEKSHDARIGQSHATKGQGEVTEFGKFGRKGKGKKGSAAKDQKNPGDATKDQEKPGDATKDQEKPGDATKDQEKTGDAAKGQGKTGDAAKGQGKTGDAAKGQGKTGDAAKGQGKTGDAAKGLGKTGDAANVQDTKGPADASEKSSNAGQDGSNKAGDGAKGHGDANKASGAPVGHGDTSEKSKSGNDDLQKSKNAGQQQGRGRDNNSKKTDGKPLNIGPHPPEPSPRAKKAEEQKDEPTTEDKAKDDSQEDKSKAEKNTEVQENKPAEKLEEKKVEEKADTPKDEPKKEPKETKDSEETKEQDETKQQDEPAKSPTQQDQEDDSEWQVPESPRRKVASQEPSAHSIELESYYIQRHIWPADGRHILAHYDNDSIVVYQAFKPEIADYAVENQEFGGPHFSFSRMSWIKTSFMWMMYRSGWATKKDQECILAVKITRDGFDEILAKAFTAAYEKAQLDKVDIEVRLQWDPDHGPSGSPERRRAIQLGLKKDILKKYATEFIVSIEDITPMVHERHHYVTKGNIMQLQTPRERVYPVEDAETARIIGVDEWALDDEGSSDEGARGVVATR